jgi:hypothetical protein
MYLVKIIEVVKEKFGLVPILLFGIFRTQAELGLDNGSQVGFNLPTDL